MIYTEEEMNRQEEKETEEGREEGGREEGGREEGKKVGAESGRGKEKAEGEEKG